MVDSVEYSLDFEERKDYLYVYVTGPEDSFDISRAFFTKVHEKAKELGYQKILVEEDFPNQISITDMFDVGKLLKELFPPPLLIAHVDRNPADIDLNKFGELVAQNRGILGRIFSSIEDAEEWLRSHPRE